MSRTTLKVAVGVLAAGLLTGGVAYAAIPSADGTITACYTRNAGLFDPKGAVRVVDSARECQSHETPLTWNQRGEPGPAGPAGPQGETGPQGPAGPAGGLSGRHVYYNNFSVPPGWFEVSFPCQEAGQVVVGAGDPFWPIAGFESDFHYSGPTVGTPNHWDVRGKNTTGAARDVQIYLICLDT